MEPKETLHRYLVLRRGDLLVKLDDLGEYDIRRPMTASGTNLLGLVKHVASVQLEYFGLVFGRPARELPWMAEDAEANADMWATEDESRADILELHHYSAGHADATIDALPLDAPGSVPWWEEHRRAVTLHQILVHMGVETARHAGHADILRELLDGRVGNGPADPNIPFHDPAAWSAHSARLESAARVASGRSSA